VPAQARREYSQRGWINRKTQDNPVAVTPHA
jgi:hypothetical protein